MSINFKPVQRAALDQRSGISIRQTRVISPAYDPFCPAECHYEILRGEERLGHCGISEIGDGSELTDGVLRWVQRLDLRNPAILSRLLGYKHLLATDEDDFTFLRAIARGIVLSDAAKSEDHDVVLYAVLTSTDALAAVGVDLPADFTISREGEVLLAELILPPTSSGLRAAWLVNATSTR